jgi:hypothetical protein
MSKLIKSIALVSCLLFVSPVLYAADPLTEWEHGIFMEIVQRWHDLLYTLPNKTQPSTNDLNNIYQQVATKYNITQSEVKRIDGKGIDLEPSERDYQIYDELWKRMDALPKSGTTDDVKRIHIAVANQFGISLARLHEIEYLMDEGFWGY